LFSGLGTSPEAGVPDMTVISDIDELGINKNLLVRYGRDQIYVSFTLSRVTAYVTVGRPVNHFQLFVKYVLLTTTKTSTYLCLEAFRGVDDIIMYRINPNIRRHPIFPTKKLFFDEGSKSCTMKK
jgi:hypothetical protein